MSNTPWMDIAKREIGQKEIEGNQDNPRVVEYFRHTALKATDDETPWCAAFVCFCLESAGLPSTKSARARDYERYGVAGNGSHGDIAVFWRNSPSSGQGHVAFVDRVEGNRVFCLGGNQSDAVKISGYDKSELLGFRRPAGNGGPPKPPTHNDRPLLKLGAKGSAVKELQQLLNRRGYRLEVDGDFGAKTAEAVRAFQDKQNIDVDGEVGPVTWSRLLA